MLLWIERLALAFFVGTAGFNAVTFMAAAALSRRRFGPLLVAFLRDTLAAFFLIPAWPFFLLVGGYYRARHEASGPSGKRRVPVILLHGYAMNRTNWLWFGPALARRGIGPLYGYTYYSLQPVATSARELGRFVDQVLEIQRAERVDIVAHSLGGLVSRYYIERLGGEPRVRRLVTIATPHRGTWLAHLGIGPVARELMPEAPIYTELGPPPPGSRYTSVWSRSDNLVIPAESARLHDEALDTGEDVTTGPRDPEEDVIFPDLGHLSLLTSPRVANAVAERLAA